jgi:hypothetical protein
MENLTHLHQVLDFKIYSAKAEKVSVVQREPLAFESRPPEQHRAGSSYYGKEEDGKALKVSY